MSAPRFILDHYINGVPVCVPADLEERRRVADVLRESRVAQAAGVAREAAELFAAVEVEPAEQQVVTMLSQVSS